MRFSPTYRQRPIGMCRNFHLPAIWRMLACCNRGVRERESKHGAFQRGPCCHGHDRDLCTVVGGRPLELSSYQTIDLLRTEERDEPAATHFLTQAIRRQGVPETMTIDGREAKAAAMRGDNAEPGRAILIRQVKYRNTILEQDHRAVKRITRPIQGFKSFDAAQYTRTGIELMPMLRKDQLAEGGEQALTPAHQFSALAA